MTETIESKMHSLLFEKYGYRNFRPGQRETIEAALKGQDTLVMLPTGTGKSLCYQLPSYLLSGMTLIISPLLSLMEDQVEKMKSRGEKSVVALNSFMNSKDKNTVIQSLHKYKFVFMSPEMIQQARVITRLRNLPIALLVIDEAHCISQWGMDFRPDYLKLGTVRSQLKNPVTMALTATAVGKVREEIKDNLNFDKNVHEVVHSVNRPSIQLRVLECDGDKDSQLYKVIEELKGPGIIYFSSKKLADRLARQIREATPYFAESYHSDIDNKDKKKIQSQFIQNKIQIICATSAFGMGIDKSDVRFVIHYHLPANPEMYLQEIGRCSRDQRGGVAVLLYERGDEYLQKILQEDTFPNLDELKYAYANPDVLKGLKDDSKVRITHYFISQGVDYQTAQKVIEERLKYKKEQLKYMIHYALTEKCKRKTLLTYFDEQYKNKAENCCSSCQSQLPLPYDPVTGLTEEIENEAVEWENVVKKIFNL